MYNGKKISLVIPCHNEEKGIGEVLKDRPSFIDEIIVIDNNSIDKTPFIARQYGATILQFKEKGYGSACKAGLMESSGDVVVIMDGDNSYYIQDVERLLNCMQKKDYDFINGCRFPLTERQAMHFMHKIGNCFISWLIRVLLSVKIKDSQSGMCAFRRSLLPRLLSSDISAGFAFAQEIKIRAWSDHSIQCGEIHINYRQRLGVSKIGFLDGINNLYRLIRLPLNFDLHKTCN